MINMCYLFLNSVSLGCYSVDDAVRDDKIVSSTSHKAELGHRFLAKGENRGEVDQDRLVDMLKCPLAVGRM